MTRPVATDDSSVLNAFHPAVKAWFSQSFPSPTLPQTLGWPALVKNESTLILAPTGSGKTLTAFLHCIDRLMFSPKPEGKGRCRVLYLSPIKALQSYKSGERSHPSMRAIAGSLTDQDMANLAAYYGGVAPSVAKK